MREEGRAARIERAAEGADIEFVEHVGDVEWQRDVPAVPHFADVPAHVEIDEGIATDGGAEDLRAIVEDRQILVIHITLAGVLDLRADLDRAKANLAAGRSEERRVGKECVSTCRSRWSSYHSKKNR